MADTGFADGVAISEHAFAKINLALHVTGQKSHGYHLLEMLVTFTRCGDQLEFAAAAHDEFRISGRFGDALTGDGGTNLVLKARDALRLAVLDAGGTAPPVMIHLRKDLPIASGIGGGSADAAATLRGLMRLWSMPLPAATLDAIAIELGADVPMCLASRPLIARGIGERIETVRDMPVFPMVLANPLKAVSTPDVFRRLDRKTNGALAIASGISWLEALRAMRNDLERPARAILPEIAEISDMLRDQGALFVRMSGSGATCFGIFANMDEAEAAARALHGKRPDWYFEATETLAGDDDDRR
ncbi:MULTISPECIES: 4-(cytidine 5'-diphospho)-2-C-methyl-D-erythritol kinase [unclassified Rhizobium]|uniref:4-(cytidine 5'-diphospho)-2-C-methyl-D-erythritol kinase n=1 Tax=unclassified Rhizobium TaxID=2613769 RepID=UPI001ADBB0BA|nr:MULTISPECIES: 4-(cytidine 5'-diphospho)-2-C-methyl-D-erythritol kinase [unclassified Rhizobium]MBO9122910.1 4-(cytidine 5'-diphospho)-2-C-methyl-D-erythritol kinase [Rhizobium sp. 16-488-2b]MBO9173442.1 4-(cytidine 5'-diphospho)-2-C-methyl-D-erythritol kinase [Rhizobium sp. 16-488-2a]